jgi:hypothetical protein
MSDLGLLKSWIEATNGAVSAWPMRLIARLGQGGVKN